MASKGLAALQECSGEGKGVYFEGQYIGNVIEEASLIRNEYKHVIQKIHLTPENGKGMGHRARHPFRLLQSGGEGRQNCLG